jgi:hypothetical protein
MAFSHLKLKKSFVAVKIIQKVFMEKIDKKYPWRFLTKAFQLFSFHPTIDPL